MCKCKRKKTDCSTARCGCFKQKQHCLTTCKENCKNQSSVKKNIKKSSKKRKSSSHSSKPPSKKFKKTTSKDPHLGIRFLKQKGVINNDPDREAKFQRIRNPRKIMNVETRKKYTKIAERLSQIVNQDEEKRGEEIPDDIHTFTEEEFPDYEDENVFFLSHEDSLVQRYQLSGLCYMHAPAVVQYYAVVKQKGSYEKMIDLLDIIKNHFTPIELKKHIFNNRGESSHLFLDKILEPRSIIISESINIPKAFGLYGVGLVSSFKVYRDFQDKSVHTHYGQPRGKFVGYHSMALVGYRREGKKKFYLIQNWWKDKQFVEVDDDYLENCGATIYFIKTPQNRIPKSFAKHSGHYFELAEGVDKAEGHVEEVISSV